MQGSLCWRSAAAATNLIHPQLLSTCRVVFVGDPSSCQRRYFPFCFLRCKSHCCRIVVRTWDCSHKSDIFTIAEGMQGGVCRRSAAAASNGAESGGQAPAAGAQPVRTAARRGGGCRHAGRPVPHAPPDPTISLCPLLPESPYRRVGFTSGLTWLGHPCHSL